MRIGVQLTGHDNPENWHFIDSADWLIFAPGRSIFALLGPGTPMAGYDHYAVEDIDGACHITVWNDQPNDTAPDGATPVPTAPDEYYARRIIFHGLKPDIRHGGAYNSKAEHIVYAAPKAMERLNQGQQSVIFLPWANFKKPANVRDGEWITDLQSEAHEQSQGRHSWREWIDGVPIHLIRDGKLKPQRPEGLFAKPDGTITYYLRDTARAVGAWSASNELAAELTAGAGETTTESIKKNDDELPFSWAVPTNQPNFADWPSGVYNAQFDASTVGLDLTFGLNTQGGSSGRFSKLDSTLATQVTLRLSNDNHTSPAGLKLSSSLTWDPASGNASDRYAIVLACANANTKNNQDLTITFDADSYMDGPWEAFTTQNVNATAAVIASRGRTTIETNRQATADGVGAVTKALFTRRDATAAGIASVAKAKLLFRFVVATAAGVATASAMVCKQVLATAAGIAATAKTTFANRAATAAGVAAKGSWTVFHNVRAVAAGIGASTETLIGGITEVAVNATAAGVASVRRTTSAFRGAIAAAIADATDFHQGVEFDGTNDWIELTNLPGTDGKTALISLWVKFSAGGDGVQQNIFRNNGGRYYLEKTSGNVLRLFGRSNDGGSGEPTILVMTSGANTYSSADGWLHVLIAWDVSAADSSNCWMIVNRTDVTDVSTYVQQTTFDMNFERGDWGVFSDNGGNGKCFGAFQEVWISDTGDWLDLSSAGNWNKFVSTAGRPVPLGTDGSTPTGTQPMVYFKNNHGDFETNRGTHSNADITLTGALANEGTFPFFAVGITIQNVVATAAVIASRSVTVFHSLRATAAALPSVAKLILLIRQATAAGVATVSRVKLALRQAFATAAGIAGRSVTVFHNVPGTAAGVAVKGPWTVFHNVRATAAAIGASIEQKIGGLIQRSVNATAAAVATVRRTSFITRLATAAGIGAVQRTIFHFLSAAAAGVATRTLLILKLVQATVAGVGAVVSSLNPAAIITKSVSAVADVVASVTARVITSVKPFVGSGGLGISKVSSWRRRQATWRPKR